MSDEQNIPNDGAQTSSDDQDVSALDQAMSDVPADDAVIADDVVDFDDEDLDSAEGEE